jgi:hypothetical protein
LKNHRSTNNIVRWLGTSAIVGGVLWTLLRPFISNTWGRPTMGFTYEDYNRMMVLPLIFLLTGAWGLGIRYWYSIGKLGRTGGVLVGLGLLGALAGVVVEFWWAGGLSGNRDGAMWGWLTYLLGLAALTIGLTLYGVSALLQKIMPAWSRPITLLMASLLVLWVLSSIVGLEDWGNAGKALVGLGWVLLGMALISTKASARQEITFGPAATH